MKAVIILAAGNGTRMKSNKPKVLHEVGGKAMLSWVVDAVSNLKPKQTIVVSSINLKEHEALKNFDVVVQENPKGTGEALQLATKNIKSEIDEVFLVCADTPFLDFNELRQLEEFDADLTIMGMHIKDLEKSYGRVVLNENKIPVEIVETKYNHIYKNNPVANAGVYKFKRRLLDKLLSRLDVNKESGEIYATDLVKLAFENDFSTALVLGNEENFLGINTQAELQQAENIFQNRMRNSLIEMGVKFTAPETCFFKHDTIIEGESDIEPYVVFGENVIVKKRAHILSFCYLSDCVIESNASIGPFAHLRGKTVIKENAAIGNFVEIKGSLIDDGAKIKHLSYVGDAKIGVKSNVGAGTITCNYNGFEKFKTVVGDGVMVGANSTLVAPVEISNNAYIAAGSIITENVKENSLAITRVEQKEKINWTIKFREKYRK